MNSATGKRSETLEQRWPDLTVAARVAVFRELSKRDADHLFVRLSTRYQLDVLLHLPAAERSSLLRLLPPDDAADLIQAASGQDLRDSLLGFLDVVCRGEVTALMAYKEDRAGGLMNPHFAQVPPEVTAGEAIGRVRLQASDVDSITFTCSIRDDDC